jgi:hypothetical protein
LQSTTVAAAAELGVNPLAGFSITFWTELIGAPGYYASILHVTTTGEADGVVGAPVVGTGTAQRRSTVLDGTSYTAYRRITFKSIRVSLLNSHSRKFSLL